MAQDQKDLTFPSDLDALRDTALHEYRTQEEQSRKKDDTKFLETANDIIRNWQLFLKTQGGRGRNFLYHSTISAEYRQRFAEHMAKQQYRVDFSNDLDEDYGTSRGVWITIEKDLNL